MSRRKTRQPKTPSGKQVPGAPVPSRRKRKWWLRGSLIALAICLPALLSYSDSFHAGFTLDNEYIILRNPAVQAATSSNVNLILEHTYWWPKMEVGLYRPFTTLTYLFNYAVLGEKENPFGYHLMNFLLHCINVLLIYLLARRFIHTEWLPELIAMAWAVHPVLTESVTNIVGRADLLAGAAILGGFLLYLSSKETSGWQRIACLVALLAITTVGVFSKENAVALLGIVILYEATFWNEKRNLRAAAMGCFAILVPILFLVYERSRLLASYPPQLPSFLDNPLFGARFVQGKLTVIAVMARYIWKIAWPATLSADYSYNQIPLAGATLRDWIDWGVIATILVAAAVLYKRNKTVFFFMGFAFITFLPTSNLIFNIGTIMAERFLYLPAIGFTVCVVLIIHKLSERIGVRMLAPIAMGLIIGGWGIRTYARNRDWQDDSSLATSSVKTSPESYKTHAALARALFHTDPIRQNIDAALGESERSLAILREIPDDRNEITPYLNVATYYEKKGDLSLDAGTSTAGRGDPSEAARAYQRALEVLLHGVRIDRKRNEMQREFEVRRGIPESQIGRMASPRVYIELATIYLKLKDFEKAYRTGLYARALMVQSEEASLLTAEAAASAGRKDESAVALVADVLVTGDKRFLAPLNVIYRSGLDPKGCAFTSSASGSFLNNSCEPVHADICAAYADIIEIYRWNLKQDLADEAKSRAIGEFGCVEKTLGEGRKIQEYP
jgi:tetratricopeptide (TPR) repeat protein